ncbi:MAG: arsenate reductase ArsC [Promethearchaeota archaeon]
MSKPNVIFLCTGNSSRSQIAEAILRKYAGDRFNVYSAGFDAQPINKYTIKVLTEQGYDISTHFSKNLSHYLGKKHFDIVITVCALAEKACPIIPGVKTHLHWPIEDPIHFHGSEEEILVKFRKLRDQIELKIKEWLKEQKVLNH